MTTAAGATGAWGADTSWTIDDPAPVPPGP
jgi:hypothetical protein